MSFIGGTRGRQDGSRLWRQSRGDHEPFARKFQVSDATISGSSLPTLVEFAVAGVYSGLTRDQGVMLIDRRNFDRYWDEPGWNRSLFTCAPGCG